MTGADGTYDYKAMAAGIVLAGGEGMGNLLPVGRFLPAGLMTSTVESPRWSAWAIEQIGTLYGTPGTPSSADAVPGFPIFGASNDSSPTR